MRMMFTKSAEALQRVCDHVSTVIEDYGLNLSDLYKWYKGVIIWKICGTGIDETEEYRYLGVTVKGGPNGVFLNMGDRMK